MSGCDYCDEGLPKDSVGWHLRVDPEGVEGTQRIPCQARDEQQAWTMVDKIAGLIEERDALKQRVEFLVAEAHGWQPRLEAAEAELANVKDIRASLAKALVAMEAEVARLNHENGALEEEARALREALAFYRDADAVELACDEGNKARAALGEDA